jgi:lipopolysaccharide/colanic/teichoic acid biosynthesis glycosyltransferase
MRPSKRLFDVSLAGIGLALLSPALVIVALLIKLEDGGPVLYGARRVGRHGEPLRVWKFRTMQVGADELGPGLTVGVDPRVTKLGRTLRRYKVDELPQLFNVLVGDMSLVGPRPEDPRYVERYTPEERRVLDLLPGITDPASIAYSDESRLLGMAADPEREYVERIMSDKIRLNLEYAARASVFSDARVVLRTLQQISASRS